MQNPERGRQLRDDAIDERSTMDRDFLPLIVARDGGECSGGIGFVGALTEIRRQHVALPRKKREPFGRNVAHLRKPCANLSFTSAGPIGRSAFMTVPDRRTKRFVDPRKNLITGTVHESARC
jgi:hypothetical protein